MGFVELIEPGHQALSLMHATNHGCLLLLALLQYAVSDHTFFDMAVDITLEVLSYRCSEQLPISADFMFIGFIHKDTISLLDPQGDINTQLTKLPSCYGEPQRLSGQLLLACCGMRQH